jgi:hypothetical protein
MHVADLRSESVPQGVRLCARFTWEDSERPEETIAFEIDGEAAADAEPAPEAFVLVGALAAAHHGERRIRIDGRLCPRFREGLRTALRTVRTWYPARFPAPAEPELEASAGFRAMRPPAARAAVFLSGGVDSLFVLRRNRRDFPPGHPASFRDAIHAVGFGAEDGSAGTPRAIDVRARQRSSVEAAARLAGVVLVAVRSRVDVLGEDNDYFLRVSGGAHLIATALLFPRRYSSVSVAASCDAFDPLPWSSHPLLDLQYATSATEIRHEGLELRREERVAALADWPEALPHLTVCVRGPLEDAAKNCGRCEKCLRTMLALQIAGMLRPPAPFPGDVRPEQIDALRVRPTAAHLWLPLREPLRAIGRGDLAAAIDRLERRRARLDDWLHDRGWRGTLRRADRRLLGGRLVRLRRAVSSPFGART